VLVNNATLNITGNLEGDLENGNDCLLVGPSTAFPNIETTVPETLPIQVGGHVIILGRLGNDVIALAGTEVQKSVDLRGGDQADSIAMSVDLIHGNLSVNGNGGADDVAIDIVAVLGTTAIRGEGGNDRVVIHGLGAGKDIAFYLGSGDDQLAVSEVVADEKVRLTVDGGTGTDGFALDIEVTDPPVKLRSIEDPLAPIDPFEVIVAINDLLIACLTGAP
jgi:hypothetical protein